MGRLDIVDKAIVQFFKPAADKVMGSADPTAAMAAALAALSGVTSIPKPRSLLAQVPLTAISPPLTLRKLLAGFEAYFSSCHVCFSRTTLVPCLKLSIYRIDWTCCLKRVRLNFHWLLMAWGLSWWRLVSASEQVSETSSSWHEHIPRTCQPLFRCHLCDRPCLMNFVWERSCVKRPFCDRDMDLV